MTTCQKLGRCLIAQASIADSSAVVWTSRLRRESDRGAMAFAGICGAASGGVASASLSGSVSGDGGGSSQSRDERADPAAASVFRLFGAVRPPCDRRRLGGVFPL